MRTVRGHQDSRCEYPFLVDKTSARGGQTASEVLGGYISPVVMKSLPRMTEWAEENAQYLVIGTYSF